jgi:ABC-2 type transport system permease protein
MINKNYFFLIWKLHRGLLVFSIIFLTSMQFLIIWLFGSLDYVPILEAFIQQLPPQLRVIFTDQFIQRFSIQGATAFGFNHPLVLAVLAISAIVIPAHHIAGEIENGTLEILLAHPLLRKSIIISLTLSYGLFLLLIIAGGWIGSISALFIKSQLNCQILFKLLQIGANLWLLFILIMSYTLLASTSAKEGSRVGIAAASITLLFYLFNFLSTMWDTIQFTKIVNIFTYYQPQKLMFGEAIFWKNSIFLISAILICQLIALFNFQIRDIP